MRVSMLTPSRRSAEEQLSSERLRVPDLSAPAEAHRFGGTPGEISPFLHVVRCRARGCMVVQAAESVAKSDGCAWWAKVWAEVR
jgi:hypothetical protein